MVRPSPLGWSVPGPTHSPVKECVDTNTRSPGTSAVWMPITTSFFRLRAISRDQGITHRRCSNPKNFRATPGVTNWRRRYSLPRLILCFGGHPKDYIANPAKDVIEAIPSVWDETRVLPGSEPGKLVAEARRSGDQWFVAVINGGSEANVDIPLDFLAKGTWQATELLDAKDHPDAWDRETAKATAADHIRLTLSPRGGFVARIRNCGKSCK